MTKYTTLMMRSQSSYNLLWQVCRQFSMNWYRLRVWVGRDRILFVSCFPVSIVSIEKPLTTMDTGKQDTNIILSLPTHTLRLYQFILNCLHTCHNKTKVIRWLRSHHQSSILFLLGTLLSRLSGYNLKMA